LSNRPEGGRKVEYIERDGVKLAYDRAGGGDPALVFVHGWSCDRSYFAPQFEHFARRNTVVTVDLRGHGDSSQPEPGPGVYDVDTFADDVLAVCAELDQPVVVVGHSLGGLIALACAARAGAVRAAVMVDPAPIVNAAVKAFLGGAVDPIAADDDGSWRKSFVSGMFLPSDTARRDEIIGAMTTRPPAVAAASARAIAEFDGLAALGAVEVPLLSIGSSVPSDAAADLLGACARITIGQTVGSGHFNQLEVPDQVNAMIERFLVTNGF
jgi:pimeloyl-ACP methyl ester carboxylesterase